MDCRRLFRIQLYAWDPRIYSIDRDVYALFGRPELAFCRSRSEAANVVLTFLERDTGAIACWTKPSAAFSVLFILLYISVQTIFPEEGDEKTNPRRAIRTVVLWIAGATCVSLAICGYFISKDVFL